MSDYGRKVGRKSDSGVKVSGLANLSGIVVLMWRNKWAGLSSKKGSERSNICRESLCRWINMQPRDVDKNNRRSR